MVFISFYPQGQNLTGWSPRLIPTRNSDSAMKRLMHRFLWMVLRSLWRPRKKQKVKRLMRRHTRDRRMPTQVMTSRSMSWTGSIFCNKNKARAQHRKTPNGKFYVFRNCFYSNCTMKQKHTSTEGTSKTENNPKAFILTGVFWHPPSHRWQIWIINLSVQINLKCPPLCCFILVRKQSETKWAAQRATGV